jgi:hypothetical protein
MERKFVKLYVTYELMLVSCLPRFIMGFLVKL